MLADFLTQQLIATEGMIQGQSIYTHVCNVHDTKRAVKDYKGK